MEKPTIDRVLVLAAGIQGLCAIYYLFDLGVDLSGRPEEDGPWHLVLEGSVAVGLLLGLLLSGVTLRRVLRRKYHVEVQLKAASGSFSSVLEEQFTRWRLTPAEADVARFTLKGMSIAEIAELREKSEGTIKAQSSAVYKKAGVGGRTQLLSFFVEDLMADAVAT